MAGKIKNCYVAAPTNVGLGPLRTELRRRGISIVGPDEWSHHSQLSPFAKGEFQSADLFIGILSRERRSDWILFELGMAWSRDKRALLIVHPSAKVDVPSQMPGLLVLRADPRNSEAIGFALDQLSRAPDLATPQMPSVRPNGLGPKASQLRDRALQAIAASDPHDLESIVAQLFRESNLVSATSKSAGDQGADFAVWTDELFETVGNPLLVEVKLRLRERGSMSKAALQLSSLVSSSGTRFGLLIFGEGPRAAKVDEMNLPFNVLALSVLDLLTAVETNSFSEVVRQIRNRRVHGVD